MARFDIFRSADGPGYLLDVQSNVLSGLSTHVVVPLLPRPAAPLPAQRLNPVFEVMGSEMIMATQFIAAVSEAELRASKGHLGEQQHEISAALDMLFAGF